MPIFAAMCGRFALTASPEEVEAHFAMFDLEMFPPRYNIAPTQPVLMITAGERPAPGSNQPGRRALLVRWGLIPSWVKDPKGFSLLINARSETASEKQTFRAAMRYRRTLIPASGFYEWRRDGARKSQAFWVRPKQGGVVAFAGLLETWLGADGSEIDTGAVLTTHASENLVSIHDRMPVVIAPEEIARWLNCRDHEPAAVADLLHPVEPGFFEAIPVSDRVNTVANTGPEIQARVEPETAPVTAQLTLF